MLERRTRRSESPEAALRLLLESVLRRSEASTIAVVDADGNLIGGAGRNAEMRVLSEVAQPVSVGTIDARCEKLTRGTDVLARPVSVGPRTVYLAALGSRVPRMHEVAAAVARIVAA